MSLFAFCCIIHYPLLDHYQSNTLIGNVDHNVLVKRENMVERKAKQCYLAQGFADNI